MLPPVFEVQPSVPAAPCHAAIDQDWETAHFHDRCHCALFGLLQTNCRLTSKSRRNAHKTCDANKEIRPSPRNNWKPIRSQCLLFQAESAALQGCKKSSHQVTCRNVSASSKYVSILPISIQQVLPYCITHASAAPLTFKHPPGRPPYLMCCHDHFSPG